MSDTTAAGSRAQAPGERPVALVTGATSGIGRAAVERLVPDHRVLAVGRDPEALERLPDGAEPVRADLTDFAALPRLVEGLERLDVLVHAAALGHRATVESARPEDWRAQLELNVMVPAELTRLALPALRRAEGTVVLLNSGAGFTASDGNVVYAASKFALRALADSLRKEVEPDRIRVASVHPGPTDTPMLQGIHDSIGKPYRQDEYIRPESVAAAIRAAVDAPADMQLTTVSVRPRQEQR
ncbi:SDR family oxidoreductase [Kocuria palustris]|uniref:SDR family oxidoreductase n=1 Tax=Kocuria palustris TaxID=71999 RepID=UPI0011A88AD3|nr:SDR family oxidoreductase [Kocuria palustris]